METENTPWIAKVGAIALAVGLLVVAVVMAQTDGAEPAATAVEVEASPAAPGSEPGAAAPIPIPVAQAGAGTHASG